MCKLEPETDQCRLEIKNELDEVIWENQGVSVQVPKCMLVPVRLSGLSINPNLREKIRPGTTFVATVRATIKFRPQVDSAPAITKFQLTREQAIALGGPDVPEEKPTQPEEKPTDKLETLQQVIDLAFLQTAELNKSLSMVVERAEKKEADQHTLDQTVSGLSTTVAGFGDKLTGFEKALGETTSSVTALTGSFDTLNQNTTAKLDAGQKTVEEFLSKRSAADLEILKKVEEQNARFGQLEAVDTALANRMDTLEGEWKKLNSEVESRIAALNKNAATIPPEVLADTEKRLADIMSKKVEAMEKSLRGDFVPQQLYIQTLKNDMEKFEALRVALARLQTAPPPAPTKAEETPDDKKDGGKGSDKNETPPPAPTKSGPDKALEAVKNNAAPIIAILLIALLALLAFNSFGNKKMAADNQPQPPSQEAKVGTPAIPVPQAPTPAPEMKQVNDGPSSETLKAMLAGQMDRANTIQLNLEGVTNDKNVLRDAVIHIAKQPRSKIDIRGGVGAGSVVAISESGSRQDLRSSPPVGPMIQEVSFDDDRRTQYVRNERSAHNMQNAQNAEVASIVYGPSY